jgi:hypothetical protein
MLASAPKSGARPDAASRWRVRPALVVALVASLVLHAVWSLWPVDFDSTPPPEPLSVTLETMPAPPPPAPPPATLPAATPTPAPQQRPKRVVRMPRHVEKSALVAERAPDAGAASSAPPEQATPSHVGAPPAPPPHVVIGPPAEDATPSVVLPPRLDLAYKVFYGTQGFLIGAATYRFEHEGDDYRISTVAEPRGLAALLVHGRGLVESRGRITEHGLRPYEFAVERGSADKREVAYFDWDAGNVVLNGGDLVTLEPPAFDPLTILWQPYFAPPSRDPQSFTLATTRRVTRYTLTLQAEEPVAFRDTEVMTQRWHQKSDDGKTEGWFWLAPSMHYIPIKMRVTRTSRGTLEATLAAIRTDADGADVSEALAPEPDPPFKPADLMAPGPGPDNTGQ